LGDRLRGTAVDRALPPDTAAIPLNTKTAFSCSAREFITAVTGSSGRLRYLLPDRGCDVKSREHVEWIAFCGLFNIEVPMNFRRLRLIAEALFWVPLAVAVSTALHFVRLLRDLVGAFRVEWEDADDTPVSNGKSELVTNIRRGANRRAKNWGATI